MTGWPVLILPRSYFFGEAAGFAFVFFAGSDERAIFGSSGFLGASVFDLSVGLTGAFTPSALPSVLGAFTFVGVAVAVGCAVGEVLGVVGTVLFGAEVPPQAAIETADAVINEITNNCLLIVFSSN